MDVIFVDQMIVMMNW